MATEYIYQEGWKNARLELYVSTKYEPIACITSLNESLDAKFEEKTNVCTGGETVKTFKRANITVNVSGEVVTANSYAVLFNAMKGGVDQVFKRIDAAEVVKYFTAKITNLSRNNTAGEGSNFSMTLELDKNGFVAVNPK